MCVINEVQCEVLEASRRYGLSFGALSDGVRGSERVVFAHVRIENPQKTECSQNI